MSSFLPLCGFCGSLRIRVMVQGTELTECVWEGGGTRQLRGSGQVGDLRQGELGKWGDQPGGDTLKRNTCIEHNKVQNTQPTLSEPKDQICCFSHVQAGAAT